MRLFVALPVPDRVRGHVADAVAGCRDDDRLAWTRPAGWHVTVAFVGEVGAPDRVVEAVRAGVVDAPGTLSLGTGGTRVLGRGALALDVHDRPPGQVARLGAAVQQALGDAGVAVTRRPVLAHLTLGRARGRRGRVPVDLRDAVAVPSVGWDVDRVEVVRSHLGDGPARYEVVAAVPLG